MRTNESNSSSGSAAPFLSVLIATRNRPQDLVPCLRSLLALNYPCFEILILDQSTTDATRRALEAAFDLPPHVCYMPSETTGKTVALNLLLKQAKGSILVFTDDDTEVPEDWLWQYVRVFDSLPAVGIVFGQVLAGTAPDAEHGFVPALQFKERLFHKRGQMFGMGANAAMRREVVERVGGFDEVLGPGCPFHAAEEGDFHYRAQLLGIQSAADPSVTLVHRATRTQEQWYTVMGCYGTGDAAFYLKHIRCGDLRMAVQMAHRSAYFSARWLYRCLQGRDGASEKRYLKGFWQGARGSLRLSVDRRHRLYRAGKP